jgi:hypothetical protein
VHHGEREAPDGREPQRCEECDGSGVAYQVEGAEAEEAALSWGILGDRGGGVNALLYGATRAALRDARAWMRAPLPVRMFGEQRAELEAARMLAVCSLLSEACELRARAREERAS